MKRREKKLRHHHIIDTIIYDRIQHCHAIKEIKNMKSKKTKQKHKHTFSIYNNTFVNKILIKAKTNKTADKLVKNEERRRRASVYRGILNSLELKPS